MCMNDYTYALTKCYGFNYPKAKRISKEHTTSELTSKYPRIVTFLARGGR